jgi:hypothetical protein
MDKQKEEKQALGDDSDDEDTLDYGWTIVEATFCIVLCHLAKGVILYSNLGCISCKRLDGKS